MDKLAVALYNYVPNNDNQEELTIGEELHVRKLLFFFN